MHHLAETPSRPTDPTDRELPPDCEPDREPARGPSPRAAAPPAASPGTPPAGLLPRLLHRLRRLRDLVLEGPTGGRGRRHALAAAVPALLLATLLLAAPSPAEAQTLAFATHGTDDRVSVIDLDTGTVTATVPTASLPSGAAVTPDGARLLVAQSGAGSLRVVELATGASADVPVGSGPAGVAADPDGARAWVANTLDDTVSVVDLGSLAVVDTVAVGAAPLAVAADGTRVWVANFGDDTVSVIDAASRAVAATVAVGAMPAGVAAGGGRAWVANLFDDTVSVIDAGAGPGVAATIPVAPSPRGVALSPAGDQVWIAGFGDGTVTVLDAATHAVVGSAGVALNAADVAVSPDGTRVLVTDPAGSDVVVLDAATLQPLAPVVVGVGHLTVAGFSTAAASVLEVPVLDPAGMLVLVVLLCVSAFVLLRLRRRGSALLLVAALAASLLATAPAAPAAAQPAFQITDGTMADADWEVFSAVTTGGSQSAIQVPTNGNPGAYRYMNHNYEGGDEPLPIQAVHRYVGTGSTYDPATLGAVASIDASWDRRSPLELIHGLEEAFVVVQDGTAYRTALDPFDSPTWSNTVHTGLTAADFDDGAGNAPDFGATGSTLTFGYVRRTLGVFGFTDHGLDNFSVAVTAGSVQPPGDPGTLRFEFRSYTGTSGGTVDLRVLREGGDAGAVGVTVQVPLGLGSQTYPLSWQDGDGAPKTATVDLSSLPADGPIANLKPILTAPTGGAGLDPRLDKALILVAPADSGPLVDLALFLRLLFSASGAWWLLLPLAAALYALLSAAVRRRTIRASVRASAPAASPAEAP